MFTRTITIAALVAASAAQAEPDYSRILDVETFSAQSNGDTDRAVLIDNGDSAADLYVYLALEPSSDPARPTKPALVKKAAAWSGGVWGSRPSLESTAKGSLLIKSENTGIGRDKWTQTLTIVYRNKEFIVAGLTRDAYDSLEPNSAHSCDLNFLSGKGKRDGKAIDLKLSAKKLADWSDGDLPKECAF